MLTIKPPIYDPQAVQPMRDELLYVGFDELKTPEMVSEVLDKTDDKTTLVFINSVCGCAAGSARPGVSLALQNKIIPDRITTVFAGMDRDSVDLVREKYLEGFPPSSPSISLLKNGQVLFMMHRFQIEGRSHQEVAGVLADAFNKYCSAQGPSISSEKYEKLEYYISCGSKIPLNNE